MALRQLHACVARIECLESTKSHQKSIWSQKYPCNTSRKMQSHAEYSMSQSFWNHRTSHGRQKLNITKLTKPTVIVPAVQVHVAVLGIRCVYHHDVHGCLKTQGLRDVIRIFQKQRIWQVSHAPSTEHTALSELARRHQAEIPIGNDAMAKDNLRLWLTWSGQWSKAVKPNMAGFIASRTIGCSNSNHHMNWCTCLVPSSIMPSIPRIHIVKTQFCHPKAPPLHGPLAFLQVHSTATATWPQKISTSQQIPIETPEARFFSEVFVMCVSAVGLHSTHLFFSHVQSDPKRKSFCFCKEGCQNQTIKILKPADCLQKHEQKPWNTTLQCSCFSNTDHPSRQNSPYACGTGHSISEDCGRCGIHSSPKHLDSHLSTAKVFGLAVWHRILL